MKITIAQRYKPYTCLPGQMVPVPGTSLAVQVFPMLVRVYDLARAEVVQLDDWMLPLQGPLEGFTVHLDLEKGAVNVTGRSPKGAIHYRIKAGSTSRQLQLAWRKPHLTDITSDRYPGEEMSFPGGTARLACGVHKHQRIGRVRERLDIAEFLPLLFHLSQQLPAPFSQAQTSLQSLLGRWYRAVNDNMPQQIASACQQFLLAGFHGLLCPRLQDDDHQGIVEEGSSAGSPLWLVSEAGRLIRKMLIWGDGEQLHLLPALPPELHAGRFVDVQIPDLGMIDLEWSKKRVRRVILRSEKSGELQLHLPAKMAAFRLRREGQDRGETVQAGAPLMLESHTTYHLDRFVQ